MAYAVTTTVSVAKTRAEIEEVVTRYGASDFGSAWADMGKVAMISFKSKGREVRFVLMLPDKASERFTHYVSRGAKYRRAPAAAGKEWEQACRSLWRSLLLSIKAKLEAVSSGIAVFDSEFLANVVQPNGITIGESLVPRLPGIFAGKLASLPGPGESTATQ